MVIFNSILVVLFLMFASALGIFWLLDFKEAFEMSAQGCCLSFCLLLGGIFMVALDD